MAQNTRPEPSDVGRGGASSDAPSLADGRGESASESGTAVGSNAFAESAPQLENGDDIAASDDSALEGADTPPEAAVASGEDMSRSLDRNAAAGDIARAEVPGDAGSANRTEPGADALQPSVPLGPDLPLAGESDVCGVHVRTGRNGHAPGGVWLHLEAGDGLLYMGGYNVESAVYANDTPPPAGTVILDASYGAYDDTLGECTARLMPFLERGLALFPVPPGGRGPEMALHILQTRREPPHIGDDLRAAIGRLTDADCGDLRPGVADALARLAREAPPIAGRSGLMLTGTADAADGEAARLAASWEKEETPDIVFSGYLPPGTPAQRLVEAGRAHYVRWNVHPRLSDNAMLVKTCGARTALPAFGDEKHLAAWRKAFAPARVVTSGVVDF